jgi:hypothetical protein
VRTTRNNPDPLANEQPKTLPHDFILSPLRTHFIKSPNPPGANALIDLPVNDFLDTEEEFNVVAASLWTLCVKYDEIEEDKRPKHRDALRSVSPFQPIRILGCLRHFITRWALRDRDLVVLIPQWIIRHRDDVMWPLIEKIEPPFSKSPPVSSRT